jgi:hypothetical protein
MKVLHIRHEALEFFSQQLEHATMKGLQARELKIW